MTCHIALLGDASAIMVSDSQVSSPHAQAHGFQKQYAGVDFLVGAAGRLDIISALFEDLAKARPNGLDAKTASSLVSGFIEQELSALAKADLQIIMVSKGAIDVWSPATFKNPRRARDFAAIGSGSAFVYNALKRDESLGFVQERKTLAELLSCAENYLDAAAESLTVDRSCLIGVLAGGRTYQMGDATIQLRFAPTAIKTKWSRCAAKCQELLALAKTARAEVRTAQRIFSKMLVGGVSEQDWAALRKTNGEVSRYHAQLAERIDKYFEWYEALISGEVDDADGALLPPALRKSGEGA